MNKKVEFPIVVGEAGKNKTEAIVVSINQYKGKKFIDVRVNFRDKNDPDRLIPTKKGITLSMRTFEPVMQLVLDAYKQLKELEEDTPHGSVSEDVPDPD